MNIIQYARKNGIYDFSEHEFNVVDSLVLSQLVYLKFDRVVKGPSEDGEDICIRDLVLHENRDSLFRDERYADINTDFFEAVAGSKRFGNLKLNNFIDIIDTTLDIQFSAMTVTGDNDFAYVVFRGTDDSVVGWKEDLCMTFKTPVPGQKYSVDYLERVAGKIEENFYVGGHSKGGNLAVYSSMNCEKSVRNRIRHIYSHDGPGFRTELLHGSCYEEIKDRITKLVPKSAVVGLFGNVEKYEVVDCEKMGVKQHNPYNWIVSGFDFKRAKSIGKYSSFQADAISMWAAEMDDEKWMTLTDWLFGLFDTVGITNLNDLNENRWEILTKLREALSNTDDKYKEEIKQIINLFTDAAIRTAKEEAIGGTLKKEKPGKVKTKRQKTEKNKE